jgi:hypothetical protein
MDRTPEGMQKRKKYRELIGRHYVEGGLQEQVNNWSTPQASEYKGQSQRGQHRPDDRLTNKVIAGLPDQVKPNTSGKNRGQLYPTPSVNPSRGVRIGPSAKEDVRLRLEPKKGQLNPAWVEQLMGLKVGWTNFDSWAMELSRKQQKKH